VTQFHPDKHVAIFDKANKIEDWPLICNHLKDTSMIAVAEVTGDKYKWEEWESFVKTYDLKLAREGKKCYYY
jgi:hypothetical protein